MYNENCEGCKNLRNYIHELLSENGALKRKIEMLEMSLMIADGEKEK